MKGAKLKALELEHRAKLLRQLDEIRVAAGAVHDNKARQVFAEVLAYLVSKSK